MKKELKLFIRELKRLSYTFTVFPLFAYGYIFHWEKGIVSKESKVCPFFDYIFTDLLLNINKMTVLFIVIVTVFMLIWLLCYQFKISRKEKAQLRFVFEFLTNQFNNIFRILAGAILAIWMLTHYSDLISVNNSQPFWLVPYIIFGTFVITYFTRSAYNNLIIKGT